ncbi:hypothetical protein ACJMK2_020332 [Sinanodonta woodiana]|uniref:non-specific serine/threonine protein kinase n=1 Tax=Sinanodonta woodiana TaxID=1069815 RepID=A0ABD3U1M2_SINWO
MEAYPSPRPTPRFFPEVQTFSTKKSRGTPKDSCPPRPPVKSCPPISRIFPHRPIQRAQLVSFRSSESNGSILKFGEGTKDYFQENFEIISKLGAGSFGEVFKVRCREDGQLYAVKKSQERFRGESDRRRKLEEVAKYEKLPCHTNCVRLYRAWEEKMLLYMQLELCKASLSHLAEDRHDIPEEEIWLYLVDLLMAVKHLHDNNLVHMDIKPDNIFITYDNVCKLGDFGLVIDLSKGNDFSEAQEGDPKYLAPELMDGKFGKPADIFSLGISILELASDLDLPRGGDGWHALRSGHVPNEFLLDKSFDLKYTIKQMLDPCPRSRPTVDQVLAFPCIRKVWKKRRREYMVKSAMNSAKGLFFRVWEYILLITFVFTYPFRKLFPYSKQSSKTDSPHSSHSTSLAFDNSISDDDMFGDDLSINNNSIAVPLDSSFSSSGESSFQGTEDSFCKVPPRRAFTSPTIRHRHYENIPAPMSSSPVLPSSGSGSFGIQRNSSPNISVSSFEDERSLTPTFNVSGHLDFNEMSTKPNIEPKNLMDMFLAASDEED